MSEAKWPRANFLRTVREGKRPVWDSRKVIGGSFPSADDRLILFYAKSGTRLPGICGVGQVLDADEDEEWLEFKVARPTDKLRDKPWWDAEVIELIHEIRGKFWRATLFPVSNRAARAIESGIQEHARRKQ